MNKDESDKPRIVRVKFVGFKSAEFSERYIAQLLIGLECVKVGKFVLKRYKNRFDMRIIVLIRLNLVSINQKSSNSGIGPIFLLCI